MPSESSATTEKNPAEHEPRPSFTITEMTASDIDAATEMRLQSWLDTYVSPEHGVTREWIESWCAKA